MHACNLQCLQCANMSYMYDLFNFLWAVTILNCICIVYYWPWNCIFPYMNILFYDHVDSICWGIQNMTNISKKMSVRDKTENCFPRNSSIWLVYDCLVYKQYVKNMKMSKSENSGIHLLYIKIWYICSIWQKSYINLYRTFFAVVPEYNMGRAVAIICSSRGVAAFARLYSINIS